MKAKGIGKKILSRIIVLLRDKVIVAIEAINFFKTREHRDSTKALSRLGECFYYLYKTVCSDNENEQLDYLDGAFESVEKAALESYRSQLDEHVKRIALKRNLLKFIGYILLLRKITLSEIDKSIAVANDYKGKAENNHRSLQDRVDDYKKACDILERLEGKIPNTGDYLERVFQFFLMLLGIFIGMAIKKIIGK